MGGHILSPRPCAVPGCGDHKRLTRGLCSRHYQQFRNDGTIEIFKRKPYRKIDHLAHRRICDKCKCDLSIDCFAVSPMSYAKSRRVMVCKKCTNEASRLMRAERKNNSLCTTCGKPALQGAGSCEIHLKRGRTDRAKLAHRLTDLLYAAVTRACRMGLVCDLDEEWVRVRLTAGKCELTAISFDFEASGRRGHFNPYAPSIDRITPGGNYTKDNCRMVITAINIGMNHWGEEIYRKVAKKYLKHRREKRNTTTTTVGETYNLLLDDPQSVRIRKH